MFIYTETKNCSGGLVTFTPTSKGVPLFSSIAYAGASGQSGSTSVITTVLCGISTIATDASSVTFNCATSTGILLGGNTLGVANNVPVRCFIIGKENPNASALLTHGEFDGIFYKI